MTPFVRFLSPYWLWAFLSLPAAGCLAAAINSDDPEIYKQLLHPTGEFSARFMIIAMLASPLMLIFKGWRGPLWLKKNRRFFGVAAFGYAALHTVFYLMDSQTLDRVLADVTRLYIWTGWLAFVIFIPLAATSAGSRPVFRLEPNETSSVHRITPLSPCEKCLTRLEWECD